MIEQVTRDTKFNSAQEVFEFVVRKLAKQGRKSNDDSGVYGCVYRQSEKNLKCAAGHLIPDPLYDERMEGESWEGIVVEELHFPQFFDYIKDSGLCDYTDLVSDMQATLHDIVSERVFESKINFMEHVNLYVKNHADFDLTFINWSTIEFAEHMS